MPKGEALWDNWEYHAFDAVMKDDEKKMAKVMESIRFKYPTFVLQNKCHTSLIMDQKYKTPCSCKSGCNLCVFMEKQWCYFYGRLSQHSLDGKVVNGPIPRNREPAPPQGHRWGLRQGSRNHACNFPTDKLPVKCFVNGYTLEQVARQMGKNNVAEFLEEARLNPRRWHSYGT